MCGYVGFINDCDDTKNVLQSMMDKIIHRGPDSEGAYIDDNIALGFRRLSIIDLEGGSQPIFNEDESMVLLFNGEIYNYRILREELKKCGHVFRTESDSETLIHGYEEYGEDLLPKLRGMFSFVIWNKNTKELFGARDYFGIKPFYYAKQDGHFLFGSEIKSFTVHPYFKKELNEEALENYLSFQYSVMEETFFKGVFRLLPAHCIKYKDGEISIKRWWEPKFDAEPGHDIDYWVDRISETFDNSVEAHKISDVEVGSFLSSGVDSSYVACRADVDKTFTVGFGNDEKYNEIGFAKELAEYINVENISKVITPEEYWDSLSKVQYHMDEPLADPAAVALYFVCQIASENLKVVLSGEGADEIFGGYNIYMEPFDVAWYYKIPRTVRRIIGKFASLFPKARGFNFLIRRGQDVEEWFIGNANMFSVKERKHLLKSKTNAPTPQQLTKAYYDKVKNHDMATKMQYIDLNMWMAGDILLKADKMSMAHSLELRVPFLDREVMALASKIPTEYRVNNQNTKLAMRKSALRAMPQKTADKKKLGFPVPIRVWLCEDKYYNKVRSYFENAAAEKYFNTDILVSLLDEHKSGKKDNSRKIWTVFCFLLWHEQFME